MLADRRAEDQDQNDEQRKSGDRAEQGRTRAAHGGDREHDGEGLDDFDQRSEEGRRDGGADRRPGDHR